MSKHRGFAKTKKPRWMRGFFVGFAGSLAVSAALRSRSGSGSAGTTAATTAAATLTCRTYSACWNCGTILRCAFGCLYLVNSLIIAFKFVAVVIEVVASFKNNGRLMLGLLDGCGALRALGTGRTLATIAIATTTV